MYACWLGRWLGRFSLGRHFQGFQDFPSWRNNWQNRRVKLPKNGQKWARGDEPQFTSFAPVCLFLSLVQDFFSCCVSQTVCVGDSPNDGEFVGLEVETFVGTSRELKVSWRLKVVGMKTRIVDRKVPPSKGFRIARGMFTSLSISLGLAAPHNGPGPRGG